MDESLILEDMDASMKTTSDKIGEKQLEFYRELVHSYIRKIEFSTAVYWADKVVSFSSGEQQDVYHLAQCLYFSGEYLRAAHCILFWKYERVNLHFRCLYAKCLLMAKDYNKALSILDLEYKDVLHHCKKTVECQWEPSDPRKTIMGELHLTKGKIHAALFNRTKAMENYQKCLEYDVYCQEAFQLLSQYQMKGPVETRQLMKELPFSQSCFVGDGDFVQQLYTCGTEHGIAKETPLFAALSENVDVLTAKAEKYLCKGFTRRAYDIAIKVNAMDPFHPTSLEVLISCLVELKMGSDLFKISHKLIEVMPSSSLAWYSVGAYYYDRGSQQLARANLNKALTINSYYWPAWLLFGHSFAAENEHDQAMAAYFKASYLMKGSHLPLLYGGVECALTKNIDMALEFLEDALKLSPNDPFIHHEMGVIRYYHGDYLPSYEFFQKTENILKKYEDDKLCIDQWEPFYSNLGHCCRKLEYYEESLKYFRKALSLRPNNYSTYSAIGLVYGNLHELDKAVDNFHKALSLNRDDAFSNAMLAVVMDVLAEKSEMADLSDNECECSYNLYSFRESTLTTRMSDEMNVNIPSENYCPNSALSASCDTSCDKGHVVNTDCEMDQNQESFDRLIDDFQPKVSYVDSTSPMSSSLCIQSDSEDTDY